MRTRSCRTLGQGREDLRDWIKQRSTAIVKVVTDDAEIALAYLIREDAKFIVVGTCERERMFDNFQFGHRLRWVTLSIPRNRIKEFSTRS